MFTFKSSLCILFKYNLKTLSFWIISISLTWGFNFFPFFHTTLTPFSPQWSIPAIISGMKVILMPILGPLLLTSLHRTCVLKCGMWKLFLNKSHSLPKWILLPFLLFQTTPFLTLEMEPFVVPEFNFGNYSQAPIGLCSIFNLAEVSTFLSQVPALKSESLVFKILISKNWLF